MSADISSSWRGTVGLIKPTYRPGSLEETIRLLPEGIGLIPLYVGIREGTEREFLSVMDIVKMRIAELAKLKVDLIHPAGAPIFMLRGYKGAAEIVNSLEEEYGIPIITTGGTLVEGLKALKIERMVGVSYAEGETKEKYQKYTDYFAGAGLELLGMEAMTVPFTDVGRIPPYEVYAFIKKQFLKHPRAQAICMTGAGWRVLSIVRLLEQDLQVPVIHPLTALVWLIQKKLHVRQPVKGYGRLLEEMP